MITAEERELSFLLALRTLLESHGAELEVSDQTGKVTISMPSIYNYDTDKYEKDYCEFTLPGYMP